LIGLRITPKLAINQKPQMRDNLQIRVKGCGYIAMFGHILPVVSLVPIARYHAVIPPSSVNNMRGCKEGQSLLMKALKSLSGCMGQVGQAYFGIY